MKEELKEAYVRGLKKVRYLYNSLHGDFPHITNKGQWLTNANGHWTGGFWIGLLWLHRLYDNSSFISDQEILSQVKKLVVRMKDNKTHDMGFIFGPSCVEGSRITGLDYLEEMALAGAGNLKDLFEERAGLIQAWREPGYEGVSIVDTIMNIPLMIWASQQQGDSSLYETAMTAAGNIKKYFIRDDHSVYHLLRWDTKTFQIVERTTHQGYRPDSCWSRGQAWALYGFANMYRYTRQRDFLETSQQLADYFLENVDDDLFLPRWDFFFRNNHDEPLDASAAAIAASGMLLLSGLLQESDLVEKSALYKKQAEKIIRSLIANCFYKDIARYGIILEVTVDKPRKSGIRESSMYGDYYFMEALYRLTNYDNDKMINLLY